MPAPDSTYKTHCLIFDELTLQQVHDIYQLRVAVFVVEQNCVYQDIDGLDPMARHLMIYKNEQLVAYARLFNKGTQNTQAAVIGRVVVDPSFRKTGLGHFLMGQAISMLTEGTQTPRIKISAQSHLVAFYNVHGFQPTGKDYLEDGIPHTEMVRD